MTKIDRTKEWWLSKLELENDYEVSAGATTKKQHTEDEIRTALACIGAVGNRHDYESILANAIDELVETRKKLTSLYEWCTKFGAALCPNGYVDTFGEGVRESKHQVSNILKKS